MQNQNCLFQVEKFHTQLASAYLDRIEKKGNDEDTESSLRAKFQSLIVTSSLVRASFLLSRLEKTDLEQEKAILYGKVKK